MQDKVFTGRYAMPIANHVIAVHLLNLKTAKTSF